MLAFHLAKERLSPQCCYSMEELNDLLPEVPTAELIKAHINGEIPRSLGEGAAMHMLGIDVVDYLEARDSVRNPFP